MENKDGKSIGLLYIVKPSLDKTPSLATYYFYIHWYLSYGNLAWGSKNRTHLKNLRSLKKHVSRIIFNINGFEHPNKIFLSANILNMYKLNICNVSVIRQRKNGNQALSEVSDTVTHSILLHKYTN